MENIFEEIKKWRWINVERDAKEVIFESVFRYINTTISPEFLKKLILRKIVSVGDIIKIPSKNLYEKIEHYFGEDNEPIEFKVVKTIPKSPVKITENTEIKLFLF